MQLPTSAPDAPTNVDYTPVKTPPIVTTYESVEVTARRTRALGQRVRGHDNLPIITTLVFADGTRTTFKKQAI
jgi:hypothetical protein